MLLKMLSALINFDGTDRARDHHENFRKELG